MPSVEEVIKDKDFYALPKQERMKVLSRVDSDFAAMPPVEQKRAIGELEKRFGQGGDVAPIVPQQKVSPQPQEKVPEWGRENPNLYGAYGAAKGVADLGVDTATLAAKSAINLPKSTVGLLSDVGNMFLNPIDTLNTLGDVVFGGVKKVANIPIGDEEKFDAVVGHYKDKYGSLEGLNRAIEEDPASVLLDASVVLSGGGSALSKVPGMARTGEAVSGVGRATDPLNVVGKAASGTAKAVDRGVTKLAEEGLGVATGAGPGAIRQAMDSTGLSAKSNPFVKAMRGGSGGEEVLATAKESLSNLKEANSAQYTQRLANIKKANQNIDARPIKARLQKLLADRGVKIRDGELDFSRSTIGRNAQGDVEEIVQIVSEWGTRPGDNTAIGLDILKRRLDDFYSESKNSRALVTNLRNKVKGEIVNKVPEYKQMVSDYEKLARMTNEIERALSLNNKAMMDTSIRKLMSSPRETFKFRNELIRQMDEMTGGDLLKEIAGVSMQEALPKGLLGKLYGGGALIGGVSGGIAPPVLYAMAATSSPRLMGELLNGLGYTRKQAKAIIDAAKQSGEKIGQGARSAALEAGQVTAPQPAPTSP